MLHFVASITICLVCWLGCSASGLWFKRQGLCAADDMDDVADSVLLGGKDTVSICLITGFESFNISLYNKVNISP